LDVGDEVTQLKVTVACELIEARLLHLSGLKLDPRLH
jgi:hypothetical protein